MMFIKVKKGEHEGVTYECAHISEKIVPEDCAAVRSGLDTPGIMLELSGVVGHRGILMIRLPEDGDAVFRMNESNGKTVDSWHWPLPAEGTRGVRR